MSKSVALAVGLALDYAEFEELERSIEFAFTNHDLRYAAIITTAQNGTEVLSFRSNEISKEIIKSEFESLNRDSSALSSNGVILLQEPIVTSAFGEGNEILVISIQNDFTHDILEINRPVYLIIGLFTIVSGILYFIIIFKIVHPISSGINILKSLSYGNYEVDVENSTASLETNRLYEAIELLKCSLITQRSENKALTKKLQSRIEKTSKDLRRAQNLFEITIDAAFDAVIMVDVHGTIINWNKAASKIFGYSHEEAMGNNMAELIIPKDLRELHSKGMDRFLETEEGPVLNNQIEITALTKSGTIIDIELFVTPIYEDDKVFFSSFIRDITSIKRDRIALAYQRHLMSSVLDSLPANIYLKDNYNQFVYVNLELLENLGWKREVYLGRNESDFVFDVDFERLWVQDNTLTTDLNETEYSLNGVRIAEDYYNINKKLIALDENDPSTKFLLVYAYKVTQLKETALALEDALKSKEKFLSTMSHEIRNPLNIIIGNGEIVKDTFIDGEHDSNLDAIINSSNHLKLLINDILDFSKITSGNLELSKDSVHLERWLKDMVNMYKTLAEEKGIELSIESQYSSKNNVHVDELRLTQIIGNLLSNAIKFTDAGVVGLGMELLESRKGMQRILFYVKDSGIGIKAENMEKILQPFQQEYADTSRKFGGTGLGLSIVSHLITQMGGQLSISSEISKGSTFSFTLDLPIGHEIGETINLSENTDKLPSLRLLYVDDMEPNQFLLKSIVSRWGLNMITKSSVDEALEVCELEEFDAILMDIQMPEKDGITGYRMIRSSSRLNSQTPIIALTANAEKSDIEEYLAVGFMDVITKPVDQKRLFKFFQGFIIESGND